MEEAANNCGPQQVCPQDKDWCFGVVGRPSQDRAPWTRTNIGPPLIESQALEKCSFLTRAPPGNLDTNVLNLG